MVLCSPYSYSPFPSNVGVGREVAVPPGPRPGARMALPAGRVPGRLWRRWRVVREWVCACSPGMGILRVFSRRVVRVAVVWLLPVAVRAGAAGSVAVWSVCPGGGRWVPPRVVSCPVGGVDPLCYVGGGVDPNMSYCSCRPGYNVVLRRSWSVARYVGRIVAAVWHRIVPVLLSNPYCCCPRGISGPVLGSPGIIIPGPLSCGSRRSVTCTVGASAGIPCVCTVVSPVRPLGSGPVPPLCWGGVSRSRVSCRFLGRIVPSRRVPVYFVVGTGAIVSGP